MRINVLTYIQQRGHNLFQRRPNRFIVRLGEQTAIVVQGTLALTEYMQKPSKKNATRVRDLERDADEVRRILIDELNRTFVTPIDREDLFGLSRAIDDVLDYAYSTTSEMEILEVVPTDFLRSMAQMLHSAAEELDMAMGRLEHHPGVADTHAVRVKAIENEMETMYAEALAQLFKGPSKIPDVVNMMKLREIYRHMFHAVGSAEQAANIISDIVVKFY
jgi:uncharacterized protein